jgi:hypothetical protein
MLPALKRMGRAGRRIYLLVGISLLIAALTTELRKPAGQRTWQGHIAGVVPYNFRPPDPATLRASLWNPDSDQVLVPRSFGVGWSLNFAELLGRLRNRSLSAQPGGKRR